MNHRPFSRPLALVLAGACAGSLGAAPPAPPATPPVRPALPPVRVRPETPPALAPDAAPPTEDAGATTPVEGAPTPREILDRHIKAVGGEEAVRKEKYRKQVLKAQLESMPGVTSTMTVQAKAPNLFVMTAQGPMGEVKSGYDGSVGWAIMPPQGAMILTGKQLAELRREADFHRELNLFDRYPSAKTMGERTFDGGACWHVRVSGGEADPMDLFFDKGTGLLRGYEMKAETPMGPDVMTMQIKEWKDVDGVKHPSRMRQEAASMVQIVTVEEIDTSPIADSVFALPMPVKAILDRQKKSADPSQAPPVKGFDAP